MLEGLHVATSERSKSNHEEVKSGERNHVNSQLAQIGVELTGESETCCHTSHDGRNQIVKISVRGVGDLKGPLVNIVQSLVVDTEGFVGVLNELVKRQSGVVRFDNGIGNLGRGHNGKGGHHAIGEFLANLGQKKRTHTGTGTTAQGVSELEALKMVTVLDLTTDNVDSLLNELGTLSVVTLGPVVSGTGLTGDEVVGAEQLAHGAGADSILGTGLKIHKNSTGDVLVVATLDTLVNKLIRVCG